MRKGPKGQPDAFRSCISCMLCCAIAGPQHGKGSAALCLRWRQRRKRCWSWTTATSPPRSNRAGLYNVKTRNIRKFCEALIGGTWRSGTRAPAQGCCRCRALAGNARTSCSVLHVWAGRDRGRYACSPGLQPDRTDRCEDSLTLRHGSLRHASPDWALRDGHFWLIQFGKKVCVSRSPKCETCPVSDLCLWYARDRARQRGKDT